MKPFDTYDHAPSSLRRLGLDLQSIQIVLAIAEHRSLRRAAIAIGLSESSLSYRLRTLEEVLTVSLFHRSTEGVEPTNAGLIFFAQARAALNILELAMADAAAASRGKAGQLTIGLYTSLSSGNLRHAIREFGEDHPEVDLRMIEGGRSELVEGLRSRVIDILVLVGRRDDNIGENMPLWSEKSFAVMSVHHPLSSRAQLYWTDISDETLVFSTRDGGPEAELALRVRMGTVGHWPNKRLQAVSRETLFTLVALGRGITLMLESDLGYAPQDVKAVPLRDEDGFSEELMTAYRDQRNDNPASRRFWSLLRRSYLEAS